MNDLYNRIESLCNTAGVSITAMCKGCGVARGSLTDLKMGRISALSANTLAKIADYFKCPVDSLIGKEKTATMEGDGLTETQRALIEKVMHMTDDQAAAFLASASLLEAQRKDPGSE